MLNRNPTEEVSINSIKHSPPWKGKQWAQLVKKFPVFFGTPKFTAVFTRTCHCSLSRAKLIEPTLEHYFRKILPSTRWTSEWSLPFRLPKRNFVRIFRFYHTRHISAYFFLVLNVLTMSVKSTNCGAVHYAVFFFQPWRTLTLLTLLKYLAFNISFRRFNAKLSLYTINSIVVKRKTLNSYLADGKQRDNTLSMPWIKSLTDIFIRIQWSSYKNWTCVEASAV
jgi:hypothetical protein